MVKKDNKPKTTQKTKETKAENKPIKINKGIINPVTLIIMFFSITINLK